MQRELCLFVGTLIILIGILSFIGARTPHLDLTIAGPLTLSTCERLGGRFDLTDKTCKLGDVAESAARRPSVLAPPAQPGFILEPPAYLDQSMVKRPWDDFDHDFIIDPDQP